MNTYETQRYSGILTNACPRRFDRAVKGLGFTHHINVRSWSADCLQANVWKEGGESYEVTIEQDSVGCSCPDQVYSREISCKHVIMLALLAKVLIADRQEAAA
jgi:hypothetical protein